jgi:hypothetical protein
MKNILALVGLAVVLVAGAGWYFQWFSIKSEPAADGHRSFNVDVNTQKITEAEKKVGTIISNGTTNVTSPNGSSAPTIVLPTLPKIELTLPPPPTPKNVEALPTSVTIRPDGSGSTGLPQLPPLPNR